MTYAAAVVVLHCLSLSGTALNDAGSVSQQFAPLCVCFSICRRPSVCPTLFGLSSKCPLYYVSSSPSLSIFFKRFSPSFVSSVVMVVVVSDRSFGRTHFLSRPVLVTVCVVSLCSFSKARKARLDPSPSPNRPAIIRGSPANPRSAV